MKHIAQWMRDNLTLPAGMVVMAAAAAAGYQAGEANADAYKMLAEQWPKVSAGLRVEIAEAMQDDQITRWESAKLVRDIMSESRGIAWDMRTGTVEQERAKLQREIGSDQQGAGG